MKYRVRNADGELEYSSFGQVEEAWLMGLIEPEDEILEEGKTLWRKANTFPLLVKARRSGDQVWRGTWFAWVIIGVVGGTIALWLLHEKDWMSRGIGLVIAVFVSVVMINVSKKAAERAKPHR